MPRNKGISALLLSKMGLLKNILDVKGAVVQGADFSVDAHGVKKLGSLTV